MRGLRRIFPQSLPVLWAVLLAGFMWSPSSLHSAGMLALDAFDQVGLEAEVLEPDTPAPACEVVEEYDEECADVIWSEFTVFLEEIEAQLPCEDEGYTSSEAECMPQLVLELLSAIYPQVVDEECQYLVEYCAPAEAGQFVGFVQQPRPPILSRTEIAAIGVYIGQMDEAIFNRKHKPSTKELAPDEYTALHDEMLKILKTLNAEVNPMRPGRPLNRLRVPDAQGWFTNLRDKAKDLKKALDKIANDNAQPKEKRDAARARADLVQKWIDDLDRKSRLNGFQGLQPPK